MNRAVVACLALVVGVASDPTAQSPAAPGFEVTSVKPSNPGMPGATGMPVGGRYFASNVTLRDLVLRAYDLYDSMLDGGPAWQTSMRFDIQAKAADPVAGMTAMLPMLKTLLADRFKLQVHVETRELPIYALVVARDDGRLGANVARSTADCSSAEQELAKAGSAGLAQLLRAGQVVPCAIMPVSPARVAGAATMRGNGMSMAGLAQFVTPAAGRVVQDRTGLSGLYNWEITYNPRLRAAPQSSIVPPPPPPPGTKGTLSPPPPGGDPRPLAPSSDSPSLMIALEEQLGLKLVSTRGPVEILVIDSAALPEPD